MKAYSQVLILLCVMAQKQPFWPSTIDGTQPSPSKGHHKRLAIHPAAKCMCEELMSAYSQVLILLCVMAQKQPFLAFYR